MPEYLHSHSAECFHTDFNSVLWKHKMLILQKPVNIYHTFFFYLHAKYALSFSFFSSSMGSFKQQVQNQCKSEVIAYIASIPYGHSTSCSTPTNPTPF